MINAMRYQVEQTTECATIYLAGGLTGLDAKTLETLCESFPLTVRTLRLDLRAIGSLSADGMDAIRHVLRSWASSRGGEFRLSTSHLMATYRPAPLPPAHHARPAMSEALAGTYL